jgi:hypothetical protein
MRVSTRTQTPDWPESLDGVVREQRRYRGHFTNWVYHEPCDDGHGGGRGHMSVNVGDDGDFVYECPECGYTVPYQEADA